MKKILTVLMVFLMSFFITACGFSDEFWEELYDGIDNIIIDVDEDDLPEQVDEESAMDVHSEEGAYIYWVDENDPESVEVMLYIDTSETILVGIDKDMDEDLINASKYAVSEFNKVDGISLDIIEIDLFLTESNESEPDDYSEYTILITSYYDAENSAIAYNSLWFDEFETKSGEIFQSTIRFNLFYMENMDPEFMKAVAVHELAHSFGLDDLRQDSLEGVSIMYYQMDIDDDAQLIINQLTSWDIVNLEWFYKKEDSN